MTPDHDDHSGGGGLLLGVAAALLMAACCALLPLLVAGGALAAVGGFLRNPWAIGAGVALVLLAFLASTKRHRGHDSTGCCPPTPPIRTDHSTEKKDDQTR